MNTPTPQDRAAAHVAGLALGDALAALAAIDPARLPVDALNHYAGFIAAIRTAHRSARQMVEALTPRPARPFPQHTRESYGEQPRT